MSSDTEVKTSSGRLEKFAVVAIEIFRADGNFDKQAWDDLADALGSASGDSLKRTWQNFLKSYQPPKKSDGTAFTTKSTTVVKAKARGKKAEPKAGTKRGMKDVEDHDEDSDGDEKPKAKKTKKTKAKSAKKVEDTDSDDALAKEKDVEDSEEISQD